MEEELTVSGGGGGPTPFAGATPGAVTHLTGLGVSRRTANQVVFPVAPGEAFCSGARPWDEAMLELGARQGAGPEPRPAARSRRATIDRRLPPGGWRRGVPLPPGMVREDHLFVVPWGGVAPVDGSHGDLGLLDPESVYASRDGTPLPGATPREDAVEMLEELAALLETMRLVERLRHRIVQLIERSGSGTAAGIRLQLALTHVQWPLLVGASERALAAAFDQLARRGQLIVEGRSLIVPWEAWPGYAAAAGHAPGRA
jgi:hypothetical protein